MQGQIPKYIIYGENKQLIMGFSVNIHLELIPKDGNKELVRGGGRISVKDDEKAVLLYHLSTDFGPVERADLIEACKEAFFPARWNGYTVYYAPYNYLEVDAAWANKEEIYKIEY